MLEETEMGEELELSTSQLEEFVEPFRTNDVDPELELLDTIEAVEYKG